MRVYLLIVGAGLVASFWGPWWVLSPVCFIICWWQGRQAGPAFWISASGGITVWMVYTAYLHIMAEVDLATKVAGIFFAEIPVLTHIPGIILMSIIAAIVIGLVSGFSGLAGLKMRQYSTHRSG